MNYDILYSIAVDLINKKKVGSNSFNSSPNDCVCVLMTQNNSIFTGVSGSAIQSGKLVSVCAEYETIKIMMNSNENSINALVTVNCNTLIPCIPCEDCKKLILEINPENAGCFIMNPDKTFIKLKDLSKKLESSSSIWEEGWDNVDSNNNSTLQSNMSNVSEFNPIPQSPISQNNYMASISTFEAKPINEHSISYDPMPQSPIDNHFISNINSKSTLQTSVVNKSNSTFIKKSIEEDNTETSLFKERLKNIISDEDNIKISPKTTETKNSINMDILNNPKEILSKKELKSLAKERKKQAKKNSKILQNIEKRSRT